MADGAKFSGPKAERGRRAAAAAGHRDIESIRLAADEPKAAIARRRREAAADGRFLARLAAAEFVVTRRGRRGAG
jgi:hypothetical protein